MTDEQSEFEKALTEYGNLSFACAEHKDAASDDYLELLNRCRAARQAVVDRIEKLEAALKLALQ